MQRNSKKKRENNYEQLGKSQKTQKSAEQLRQTKNNKGKLGKAEN